MENHYSKLIKTSLKTKYNYDSNELYSKIVINSLLTNKKTSTVCKFKENMISEYIFDFFKRIYSISESIKRIPILEEYYSNYLKYFCTPIFSNFKINRLIRQHNDLKAEFYYYKIYLASKHKSESKTKNDKIGIFETKKKISNFMNKNYANSNTKNKNHNFYHKNSNSENENFFDKKINAFINGFQNSKLYLAKLEFDNSSIKKKEDNLCKNYSNSVSDLSILSLIINSPIKDNKAYLNQKNTNTKSLININNQTSKDFYSTRNLYRTKNCGIYKTTDNLINQNQKIKSFLIHNNQKEKITFKSGSKKHIQPIMNINLNTYNIFHCNSHPHNEIKEIKESQKLINSNYNNLNFNSTSLKNCKYLSSFNSLKLNNCENKTSPKYKTKNVISSRSFKSYKSMNKEFLKEKDKESSNISSNITSNKKIDFNKKTIDVDLYDCENIPNTKLFQTIKKTNKNSINIQIKSSGCGNIENNIKSRNVKNNTHSGLYNNLTNTKESIKIDKSKENLNFNSFQIKIPSLKNLSKCVNKKSSNEKEKSNKLLNKYEDSKKLTFQQKTFQNQQQINTNKTVNINLDLNKLVNSKIIKEGIKVKKVEYKNSNTNNLKDKKDRQY